MINSIEDQATKLQKISLDLIKVERKALAAQSDARAQLIVIKKKLDAAASNAKESFQSEYSFQEKRLLAAKIQHYIAQKARTSIKEFRQASLTRLENEKAQFRDLAGLAIKNRYQQMKARLTTALDQSDILKYEMYSGAGDHLRYQMAGGELNEKARAELKVEKDKALNWEFKGEIWEDELGHYRSSLKNVCPPEDKVSAVDVQH